MKIITQFAWIVSIIIPFLLLDFKWSLIVLMLNFVGVVFSFPLLAILKPLFGSGHWYLSFSEGMSEAILYLLLNQYLHHPDKFLMALIIVYFVNQTGRIFRAGVQKEEAISLMGFLSILLLSYIF